MNGVDDFLAVWGPDRVLELFSNSEPPADGKPNQAERLVRLADEVELFHTPGGDAYGRLKVGEHHETWALKSKDFRRWIGRKFYQSCGRPPGSQAVQDAIASLEGKAQFESPECDVFVRVAEFKDRIYIDLCDAEWRAIEISSSGWQVVSEPPVRFRRPRGMMALPAPVPGGSVQALRKFINVGSDDNLALCLSWLVAAFRPSGPYPILILQGEQGSAKSTMERILRRIIDPSIALIRTPPRDERDLLIAATNSRVIAYDNLSGIAQWLSDSLCRLATGGGFSTRQLYSDADEIFFDAMRPVILNGIDQIAERHDLADRAIILMLPRIDNRDRKDEAQLNEAFERELPGILGALLTAVSAALSNLPTTHLEEKPRMADFALWATAAEGGLGLPAGAFMRAYNGNRTEAIRENLDADLVGSAISALVESLAAEPWEGTCAELGKQLEAFVDEVSRRSRGWPQNPRALSGRLRRLVTFLREVGISISFPGKGSRGRRLITIERIVVQ